MAKEDTYFVPFTEPISVTLPEHYLKPIWIIGELQDLARRSRRDDVVFEFVFCGVTVHVNRKSQPKRLSDRLEGMIEARADIDAVCGP